MVDLEELKAKALEATPGEWTLRDRGVICGGPLVQYFKGQGRPQIVMCCGGEHIGHEQKTANERFIAAAYPDAVLRLIDRLEKSEAERDALRAELEAARKQSPSAVYMGEHYIIGGAKYYRLIPDRKLKDVEKFELYASPVPAQKPAATDELIEQLWQNSSHGTRREDIEAALKAGADAALQQSGLRLINFGVPAQQPAHLVDEIEDLNKCLISLRANRDSSGYHPARRVLNMACDRLDVAISKLHEVSKQLKGGEND